MPPIYPDAALANADWTKATWDLPDDLEYYAEMQLEDLIRLTTLPAWDAAPDDIRTFVEDRLALDPQA